MTLANVTVALSVVGLLAAGPRVLGHEAFVGLALAWTATTIFGYGIAMPTEQLVSRRLSAGAAHPVTPAARRLVALAACASGAAALWAAGSPASNGYPPMLSAVLMGIWGWTLGAIVRGRIAGRGDLRGYAYVFGAEALARAALVGAALWIPGASALLLAAAVGGPSLVGAAVGIVVNHNAETAATGAHGGNGGSAGDRTEQLAFALVAAGYQVCLNAAPIVLEWRVGATAAAVDVGAFVIASSYFRLATVLAGGFATPALIALGQAWARRDAAGFDDRMRRSVLGVTLVAGAATTAAAAAAPFALPVLYGRSPELPVVVSVALALSTVVATVAAVAATGLLATGRAMTAAVSWLSGAAALTLLIGSDRAIGTATALGLVLGPAVTLVMIFAAVSRVRHEWPQVSR